MSVRLDEARQKARDEALMEAAYHLRRFGGREVAKPLPTIQNQLKDLACLDLADELEALARHDIEALNQLADRLEAQRAKHEEKG